METKQLAHTLTIPPFGKCTLLSVSSLPQGMHTYSNFFKTARGLGLIEIGETTHAELQEITRALAYHIRNDSCIWISGIIKARSEIRPDEKDKGLEDCIISLILSKHFEEEGVFQPWFEYLPVDQVRENEDNGFSFCLFRGEA